MPQNQRRASGFASAKAEMSSSSPGRIAVPSATMSRPAGSRMKPEDARPTQVACVRLMRETRVDGVEGLPFSCRENAEILVSCEHARASAKFGI